MVDVIGECRRKEMGVVKNVGNKDLPFPVGGE